VGVPANFIKEWKAIHGEVFQVEAGGIEFVFRALTYKEFDQIAENVESAVDVEDEMVRIGVLWPENMDWDSQNPGLITALYEEINYVSCLDGDVSRSKDLLDDWRMKISGIRGEMKAFILLAMPQYKSKDLDEFTYYQLAELVALSERVVYLRQISEGIEVREKFRLEIYSQEEIEALNNQKVSERGNATVNDPVARKLMEAFG